MNFSIFLSLLLLLNFQTSFASNSSSCAYFYSPSKVSRPAGAQVHLQELAKLVDKAMDQARDPYSLAFDVRKLSHSESSYSLEIQRLRRLVLENEDSLKRSRALNEWVSSEAHALYLYDLMSGVGLAHFKNELSYLHAENVNFIESRWGSDSSFVTFSFEKEGNTEDISLLYRPPGVSEDAWWLKSESQRISELRNVSVPLKKFISADVIAPTGLKPESVGGYSLEANDHVHKSYGWEISHKKYEINQQRLMREIRDIAKLFNQTHSFHVHLAFELPHKYAQYENFIYWFKHVNDYLYLKGLEEGLHGNYLTGVANMASDFGWMSRLLSRFKGLYTGSMIQESQAKLNRRNSKYFSAGLRAEIYGEGSSSDYKKLGIELRDSTRNMDKLDRYTSTIADSIQARVWEKSDLSKIKTQGLRLNSDRAATKKMLLKAVSSDYAKLFSRADATADFGLIEYESMPIYNYKSKSFFTVAPDVANRIKSARADYKQDLVWLEDELRRLALKGEKTEIEIVQTAIRMSLATWAKKARVAELFSEF